MRNKIIGLIAILFIVSFISITLSSEPLGKSFQYYTIDGFEVPNEWQILYSKYRSRKWNIKDEKPGDKSREPDKEWYDWFSADGKTFTRREILPNFIAKNEKFLPNEKTVLGMKARWDFKGYNWISIEPRCLQTAPKDNRYGPNKLGRYTDQVISNASMNDQHYINYTGGSYILLPGETQSIGLFVWGSGYNYTLEHHVEDHLGNLHILKAGNINFNGWKRLQVDVPNYIKQYTDYLPRKKPLKLKRIRLVLHPKERLSGTFIYLDYLHGKTDTYVDSYEGEGLENSQRLWKRKKEKGSEAPSTNN